MSWESWYYTGDANALSAELVLLKQTVREEVEWVNGTFAEMRKAMGIDVVVEGYPATMWLPWAAKVVGWVPFATMVREVSFVP